MKINSTLLVAFCLLLFACPPNDDDNNIQTAILTETNYAYEGDLHRFALTLEADYLNEQIPIWEQQGEPEVGDIDNGYTRLSQIDEILLSIPAGIGLGFPPIPIPPIPPLPCLCFDLFDDIAHMVTNSGLQSFSATLRDENQEVVYSTDLSTPLLTTGLEGEFSAYNFETLQGGFTGNGTLTITKGYSENNIETYDVEVTINEFL